MMQSTFRIPVITKIYLLEFWKCCKFMGRCRSREGRKEASPRNNLIKQNTPTNGLVDLASAHGPLNLKTERTELALRFTKQALLLLGSSPYHWCQRQHSLRPLTQKVMGRLEGFWASTRLGCHSGNFLPHQ